jgi:hypothetical protein
VANERVDIPAHHIGFRKYERLSEAEESYGPRSAASLRPYRTIVRDKFKTKTALTDLFRDDEACADSKGAGDGEGQSDVLVLNHRALHVGHSHGHS